MSLLAFHVALGLMGSAALSFFSGITVYLIKNNSNLKERKITKVIINLAVADILLGIVIFYCFVITLNNGDLSVLRHRIRLEYVRVVLRYLHMVSVLSTCCLSLDRYLALCHPLRYHVWITGPHCYLLSAATWLTPLLPFAGPLTLDCMETKPSKYYSILPWRFSIMFWVLYMGTLVWHGVLFWLVLRESRSDTGEIQSRLCEDHRAARASAQALFAIILAVTILTLPDMVLDLREVVEGYLGGGNCPSLLLMLHQIVFLPLYVWANPDFWAAFTTCRNLLFDEMSKLLSSCAAEKK